MHEWALAEGVLETARDVAEREGFSKVTEIVVRIGELQQIRESTFRSSVAAVLPAMPEAIQGAALVIEIEPVAFRCRVCEHEYAKAEAAGELGADEWEAIHFVPELAKSYLRCPNCGSPDFVVTRGRGVQIDRIEGE